MNFKIPLTEKLRWSLKTVEHKFLQYRLGTNETAVTETEYGKVKGLKRMSVYDKPYYSFEGIPYAQPPVGELRFKAPQRPTPWDNVKDCTNVKDKAIQLNFISNNVEGSEDCLYLNVYTNNLSPGKARPVFVFIHGGGFMFGEANRDWFGPDYFMEKDIIVITIQYRLGVFGFLSLNTPTLNIPGNAGLKDQLMALKWVKNNCANFGGDPDCITLCGQSAGAASTHYMMLMEQTQGLFHRAILMSGNAFCCWARTDCGKRAYTIAKLTGYTGENNEKDVLDFLLNVKAKDLKKQEENVLAADEHKQRDMFVFAPTVEPYVTTDCVIPKSPIELAKRAWSNSIPIMLGCTSSEGLFFDFIVKSIPDIVKELDDCLYLVPPEVADTDRSSEETKAHAMQIKKAHVQGEKPTAQDYIDVCSFVHFIFPMQRLIRSRFSHAGSPMYLYRFDFDSEEIINPCRIMRHGRGVKGASHADDLSYLFWSILAHRLNKNSREYRTIERMIGIWTQFASTGNPNSEHINGMEQINWEPLNKSDKVHKCLNISDELKFIDLPEMEKLKIWESLFDKHKNLLY